MTEGLFGGINYLAAKKGLDACWMRQQAIAQNIANAETPGYRRVDVDSSFQAQFARALQSGQRSEVADLRPSLAVDMRAVGRNPDGNSVTLMDEMLLLQENGIQNALQSQLVTSKISQLRSAISGRAS